MPSLPLPFVIKPPCEGSSVGVHIVHRQEDVLPAMEEAVTHGPEVLVEEFIQGRELTVGILDGEALPVIHICPRSGFYDLSNKYPWMNMGGGTDYICPADLPEETAKKCRKRPFRRTAPLAWKFTAAWTCCSATGTRPPSCWKSTPFPA